MIYQPYHSRTSGDGGALMKVPIDGGEFSVLDEDNRFNVIIDANPRGS